MLDASLLATNPAEVEILALCASVPVTRFYLSLAVVAGGGECWRLWVMQVIQHHHAAVLRAPDGVELIVIALAQGQEVLHTSRWINENEQDASRKGL